MSKEKQTIEEMARVWCALPDRHDCKGCCEGCYEISKSEMLYNAGYRKQSEGEWLVKVFPVSGDKKVICSECGYNEHRGPAWNITWGMHNYCPNCGAKMKGGAK